MLDRNRTVHRAARSGRMTRLGVTAAFLVAVCGFESVGFRLSYEALHAVAVANGVPAPSAWMFPSLVDGGIVLGSSGVVRALAARRPTRPYWCVTIGFTLVSWAFNVSHAPRTVGGWAVATVAPLAQMVALELGMQELRALLLPEQQQRAEDPTAADSTSGTSEAAPATAASTSSTVPAAASTAPPIQQHQHTSASTDGSTTTAGALTGAAASSIQRSEWAEKYEQCSTEQQRVDLTRTALAKSPDLTAPVWAKEIGKGETRARDLLRAARKPAPLAA